MIPAWATSIYAIVAAAAVVLTGSAIVVWVAVKRRLRVDEPLAEGAVAFATDGGQPLHEAPRDVIADVDDADQHLQRGNPAKLPRPNISNSGLGYVGQLLKMRKHYLKEERLLGEGYVKWYLVDDGWPEPIYIQPEKTGAGEWEYRHDGKVYLFSQGAQLPDERQGMRTYIHKRGEMDPINLSDPVDVSISADTVDEFLQMKNATDPPGLLAGMNLDSQDIVRYGLIAVVGAAIIWGFIGGA